jgi:thiamine pyrophosphate-dependent acetolactate synthase large subunit-like protein
MSRPTPFVADVIAGDLARYGTRRCFALLGTANFKMSHALVEAGVELISARHECNAASMADAYAKASGELTLVSVHSGPGLTNALTGIAEAAKSRTPLVVLAGDVPNGAVKNNFYIEQADMVRAVGAVPERLHTPGSARDDALRATPLSPTPKRRSHNWPSAPARCWRLRSAVTAYFPAIPGRSASAAAFPRRSPTS